MASTTKGVLTFSTANGDKNFSYPEFDPEASTARVKALGAAIVANGSIFENVPTAFTAAKIVTTEEQEYDLSE